MAVGDAKEVIVYISLFLLHDIPLRYTLRWVLSFIHPIITQSRNLFVVSM